MAFVTQRGRGRAPPAHHAPPASGSSTPGQPATPQHASHSTRHAAGSSLLSAGSAETPRSQQRRRGSPSDSAMRESLDWNVVFPGRATEKARAAASSSARSEWTLLAEEALSADETFDAVRHSPRQPSGAASPSTLTLPPLHDGTGRFLLSDDEADDEAELSPQALLRSASADRWEGTSHASSALLSDEAPDLAASLLLPSDSSAAWSGLTPDDDGLASELHFDGLFEVARRGASDEAVASWASSSRLVQDVEAPAAQRSPPEAELTDDEWTASRTAEDEATFDALLAESPAAQSAGLASLPYRKRAPKRRHRLAGGSQRSKRSATDTTRSAGNGPRLAHQPEAPQPAAPAYQPERQAGTGTRLVRAVLNRVFAADADVLDAVLHDTGPLAVAQPVVDEFAARRRAPQRGFSHESPSWSQHSDVTDVAEESETETPADGGHAAKDRSRAASLSLVASAALAHQARLRALEPTALETLQAALVDGSLRVPAPLRLLGQLARAFHLAVWGSLEQKPLPDEHGELAHLQEVPRLWNGGLHPALRARSQSHDSR